MLIHILTVSLYVVISDEARVIPPNNEWVTNRNWSTWSSASDLAYGYESAAHLGLARPLEARTNADNWAVFGGCMYFPELNCLGSFQDDIRTRRSIPFGLSPRAVEKIRSSRFDLTKDCE